MLSSGGFKILIFFVFGLFHLFYLTRTYAVVIIQVKGAGLMERWVESALRPLVMHSRNYMDVLKKLNLKSFAGNYRTLKKYISKYNLSVAHFDYPSHSVEFGKKTLEQVLVLNSNIQSSSLKRKLLRVGLIENKCSLCHQENMWKGKPLNMILDHINGDSRDCRFENLRMVCPNCNSQLPTHCGKNVTRKTKYVCKTCGHRLNSRKHKTGLCRTCYNLSVRATAKYVTRVTNKKDRRIHACSTCNTPIVPNKSGQCKSCVNRSFVPNRPPKEQLERLVMEIPMTKIGAMYGVSDNAVKKWCKIYKIPLRPMRGYWTKIKYNKLDSVPPLSSCQ